MDAFAKRDILQYCLTKIPTIVDPVLSNLNGKDLSSASCVCWFWNTSAKRIWTKRNYFVSKLLHQPEGEEDERSMHDMGADLCKYIRNSKIYPSAAIMYISRCDEYSSKSYAKYIKRVTQDVAASLPKSCKLFGALGGGIIGTNDAESLEVEQCEGISTLLLPRNSEVFVSDFLITASDMNSAGRDVEKWRALFSCPSMANVKLVLLNACSSANGIDETVKMIGKAFGDDVIVAGGLTESIIHDKKLRKRGISGLIFSGNLSTSLIVHKPRRSQDGLAGADKEKFIENLQTLKSSISSDGPSLILMFSCVARGYGLYLDFNVQTRWIAEVFPGVPVTGMFAFGEIGHSPLRAEKNSPSGYHSYSTVLCLCRL